VQGKKREGKATHTHGFLSCYNILKAFFSQSGLPRKGYFMGKISLWYSWQSVAGVIQDGGIKFL